MSVSYGQFCPVAKASEILAARWTPLIVRELLMGARTFNSIHRGLPLISRAVLTTRLRELQAGGSSSACRALKVPVSNMVSHKRGRIYAQSSRRSANGE
jgi:hypothetical protein